MKVVVGYDASAESKLAIEWAAAVAHRRGLGLRVVSATGADPTHPAAYRATMPIATQHQALRLAEEGIDIAKRIADVDVEAVGVEQGSAAALVEESRHAQLLVVGNTGRGRLRGVRLGASAFTVAMHAECPVAVVRRTLRPLPSKEFPIVVATDGSTYSTAAVREAARLVSETQSRLRIVVAYDGPGSAPWLEIDYTREGPDGLKAAVFDAPLVSASDEQRRREAAGYALDAAQAATEWYPGVPIELVVAAGRPERVIVEAAEDASLIAVGARGRGDFTSLLLGSVSRDVIQHADCAVYIVR